MLRICSYFHSRQWKSYIGILNQKGSTARGSIVAFLFILIMEGLYIAIKDATQSKLIKGVTVEWNRVDMNNIIRLSNVFFLASGLRINVHKSSFYGIGVSNKDIETMARVTGCSEGSMPFTYLGLPIGVNMNRLMYWQGLIDKFEARLSKWKANLL
ncbi:hypothetical protein Tco_0245410 [Tanacetum coccineum]